MLINAKESSNAPETWKKGTIFPAEWGHMYVERMPSVPKEVRILATVKIAAGNTYLAFPTLYTLGLSGRIFCAVVEFRPWVHDHS